MSNSIRVSSKELMKYEVVAFMGQTPLEIALKVMDDHQVIFHLEDLDSWLIVCPFPNSTDYLVRYKNNGHIFKNSGEASLCFLALVHQYLGDSFGFDIQEN